MAKRLSLGVVLIGLLLVAFPALAQNSRQRIAFQREGSSISPSNISVMYLSGKTPIVPRDLLPHLDVSGRRVTPALSPDGNLLAFSAQVGDRYQLFSWRLDEDNTPIGSPMQLTQDNTADAKFPTWSPDGLQLAYLSAKVGSGASLEVINRDGTALRELAKVNYASSPPAWSPDGQYLLFINMVNGKLTLQKYPVGGGPVMNIHEKATITAACFSPDGTKIAALVRRTDGLSDLAIITPPVTARIACSKITGARCVSWPDEQTIIFNATRVAQKGDITDAFWMLNTRDDSLEHFTGYSEAKNISFFSIQTVTPGANLLAVEDPANATGALAPQERVPKPDQQVTIICPFQDTAIRGTVPITITAQKRVNTVIIKINDQFTYATDVRAGEDNVSRVSYDWDTGLLATFDPTRGVDLATIQYQKTLQRYPDGDYTITALAIERIDGKEQLLDTDSIRVTVKNALPDWEFPGNLTLRYRYRDGDPDEEFIVQGEGQLYGADLISINDLNATFNAKIRRSLIDVRATGAYDMRTYLNPLARRDIYPLTFGLNAVEGVPEEMISALYLLSPNGEFTVQTQMREKVYLPLAQVGLQFDDNPVWLGSRWPGTIWVVNDVLARNGVGVEAQNSIDGLEWMNGRKTIRIRSDYTLSGLDYPLALQPNKQAPIALDPIVHVQNNEGLARNAFLQTDAITGIRYTWFDYTHSQIVRVEDLVLYKFPLENVEALTVTPGRTSPTTPGVQQPGAANRPDIPPGARPGYVPPRAQPEYEPGYLPPRAQPGQPGYVPPGTQPGVAIRPGVTTGTQPGVVNQPGRTGTGTNTAATPPVRPRTGNAWYLVRWSYTMPAENPEEAAR